MMTSGAEAMLLGDYGYASFLTSLPHYYDLAAWPSPFILSSFPLVSPFCSAYRRFTGKFGLFEFPSATATLNEKISSIVLTIDPDNNKPTFITVVNGVCTVS